MSATRRDSVGAVSGLRDAVVRMVTVPVACSALAMACGVLASSAGCSNPKCWTHDASEVEGGCSLWSSDSEPSGNFDHEAYRRNLERQLAEYEPGCDAGDAIACWMVGDAKRSLLRPVAEVEAAYGVACRAGLGEVPGDAGMLCDRAGQAAEQRGGSGPGVARTYYALACQRGSSSGCTAVFRLQPIAPIELAVAACRYGVPAACVHAAKLARGSNDRAQLVGISFRGCELGVATLCEAVGQAAVTP